MSQELDFSGAGVFEAAIPNRNRTWRQEFLLTSKLGATRHAPLSSIKSDRDTPRFA